MELHTTGNTLADKELVLQRLQEQVKLKENQARALVDGKVIIKRDLNEKQARLYCEKFKQLGLDVLIKEKKQPAKHELPVVKADAGNEAETRKKQSAVEPFPLSLRDFETIFDEEISRPKVSLSYKARLVGVALLSLLTPVIYLGLTGLTVWGTISYIFAAIGWIEDIHSIIAKIIVLTIPTFIGTVLFFFLIKPFFAKREQDWGFDLQREDAPALFNLIDVMCARIDIHAPQSIRIDNNVNAAAGPENGIISLLRGKMRLYIGLPLLTGMTAKQFVGVLAHEFGHFAQPGAMLTYQLINRVNHWLYDRAFTHDSWDERLDRWQRSESWLAMIAVLSAKYIIKLTRTLFRQMYLFNHRMTQGMSRQMEYDADAYESIFCGSDSFRQTSLALRRLSLAANKVYEINDHAWYENKLLKDYAGAIGEQARLLSDAEMQQIEAQMHSAETNAWDSHPADTDRIAHVEQRGDKGIFKHEASARNFCKDFNNLSERVTRYQYVAAKIVDVDKYITNNEQILQRHNQREHSYQSLDLFFAGTHNNNQMLRMDAIIELLDSDHADWKNDWQSSINQLRQGLFDYQTLQKELDKNIQTYCIQEVGRTFIDIGVNFEADDFKLGRDDMPHNELVFTIQSQREQLAKTEALFQKRIAYALQAAKLTSKLDAGKIKALQQNFIFIKELSSLHDITNAQYQLAWIANELMGCCPENPTLQAKLQAQMRENIELKLWENLNKQWNIAARLPDLVDNPKASLLDYIESVGAGRVKSFEQLSTPDLVEKAYQVTGSICYQYVTVLAELVESCLIIEHEQGIKPIKLVD